MLHHGAYVNISSTLFMIKRFTHKFNKLQLMHCPWRPFLSLSKSLSVSVHNDDSIYYLGFLLKKTPSIEKLHVNKKPCDTKQHVIQNPCSETAC